jgi:hypothetical protein
MVSLNWADLQKAAGDAGFDVLPPGEYDARIESATAKPTANNKDSIAVQFKVEGGPYDGKSFFNNFVISPENANALAFFFRHMAALGLGEAYFAVNPPLERVAADLQGRRCRATLSKRMWNDTERNQVDGIRPPAAGSVSVPAVPAPSGTTTPMPSVTSAAVPAPPVVPPPAVKPSPATRPGPPTVAPPPPSDEDLPF